MSDFFFIVDHFKNKNMDPMKTDETDNNKCLVKMIVMAIIIIDGCYHQSILFMIVSKY